MKKSVKKLWGRLWLVCFGAMPLCVVGETFVGDDIAEIEAALAREAQAKPRLMAASARLLAATGDDNTYWATGELNVTKRRGETISLQFDIPKSYAHITSATLTMNAYDVDSSSTERDEVYFNGTHHIGTLVGGNNIWHENSFSVPASVIHTGINNLRIDVDVDQLGWVTRIEWAKLVIEEAYIKLKASSNLDDCITLLWEAPSGMSGARYYIDRRKYETDPFECLNKDNPTRERHYYDRTCLPGVKYYYRVRSEGGVESNEIVGKRVAKTVEPKFEFTLTGTDWPSTRGLNNEADVLVAGHVLKCVVTAEGATQDVSIKRIELIGSYIGGAKSGNDHKIVWSSNGESSSVWSYYTGWVTGQTWPGGNNGNNSVDIMAVLRRGPGYHGIYSWKIRKCEYEMGGTVYKTESANAATKNVYFEKFGVDNGKTTKKYWEYDDKDKKWVEVENKFCKVIPNWFTYWKEDGACPGLNNEKIISYRGRFESGAKVGGLANIHYNNWGWEIRRYVYIDSNAADLWSTSTSVLSFLKATLDREQLPAYTYGIYNVEDIVAHELQHNETETHYRSQIAAGKKDSDAQETYCVIDTGMYALCNDHEAGHKRAICDSIVDEDEDKGVKVSVNGRQVVVYGLNKGDPDTFDLEVNKYWEYGGYGDNEMLSLVAGRLGVSNANPYRDWAYPGELAGGFPNELLTCPSYHETRMLSATPKSSTRLRSSEPQSNTNLIITINSIAADAQRDQNSVTGIVYAIGVSIQGDDLVNFNGYLVDAQSNVVATAVSAANAESESVELFFDSRNIFDNYNGGPLTLGRVDLTVDGNYSTNNVIGTLYDFAVEPIEVNKSELLCNMGYILDGATTNDVSASGIAVSIPVLVNVADDYRLEAELVNTNDELVATAFATNYCATGTNVFALTFTSDAIYQNGRSGIQAVRNVQLWCGDEMIDANATALELTESRDISDFVPSGISVVVDSSSGRFVEPAATPDGMLSSLRFIFDVTNATDSMVGFDVAAILMNTNSEIVASIRTAVEVTNGLNQIEITIPASAIAKSGVNGPYRFESIELLPQGEDSCGTTYRPSPLSAAYMASDFGGSTIEPCGAPRIVDTTDCDRLTVEYSYEALRVGHVVAEIVLADRNGNLAARVVTTNDVSEIGARTNIISIASDGVVGGIANGPYAVASLTLAPDISGESPVGLDVERMTNIFWQVAPPVFSPVTKTVFFRSEQPVVISCATAAAEIRYTLDGSEPTDLSPLYVGAFTISSNTTVKAKAFVDGMRPSETVQAEYVHASIVGDNLVQSGALNAGEVQTLRLPAPGAYTVSFDYSQGDDVELRLLGNGKTNTITMITAASAGSTNFLYEVAEAGEYQLTLIGRSAGADLPAAVTGLNICIPDTGRNKSRYWIYETERTFGSTGEWLANYGFVNGKMPVFYESLFTAARPASNRIVTIQSTLEFGGDTSPVYFDEVALDGAIAGMCIAQGESGINAFHVLTAYDGQKTFLAVNGVGLAEPAFETPYTLKFALDAANHTYQVALVDSVGGEVPLMHGTTNRFPFAEDGDAVLGRVKYKGLGSVMSLQGSCNDLESGFMQGDALSLGETLLPAITEGQAAWLNSMNSYDVVQAKASSMGVEDFEEAYLLNLDITQDVFGLDVFKVSGIEVTETEVKIHVLLNRTGAIQTGEGGEKKNAPINGLLKLYGGATPQTKDILNATMMTDADFGEGNTATITYPRDGGVRFFRPVIEAKAD